MRSLRILLLSLCVLAALMAGEFQIKDGDRVVFYGDSITDQRLYTTFTETYVLTRFPGMKVRFVHSGWGGDRVSGGGGGPADVRLKRDVIAYQPTVVTIMLGMNDGGYRAFDPEIFERFASGYQHIVTTLKQALPGLRLTLIQPSPFDDVTRWPTFEGGYNAVLVRYGQFVKELAAKESLSVADLNTGVVAALRKAITLDPMLAERIIPDRVHPGPGGHLLMAGALLKAWNAPATVSAVALDAGRDAAETVNTRVTEVKREAGTIAWTQADRALPMPADPKDAAMALALRSSDFTETLNQQTLRVTGLKAGTYALRIDGETVGSFGAGELAKGVNLATLETPMVRQARQVHDLTLRHNNIHFARWRSVQVPLQDLGLERTQAAMAALDSLEDEIVERQRAAAQPRPHQFVLAPE